MDLTNTRKSDLCSPFSLSFTIALEKYLTKI